MFGRTDFPILSHYSKHWGDSVIFQTNPKNPKKYLDDNFCICIYEPRQKRNFWTYATCGLSLKQPKSKIELFLFTPKASNTVIDILYAISDYHITGEMIGLNHTVNFGIPWANGSKCSYGLVSFPYLEQQGFFENDLLDTNFLWIIPITESERNFKAEFGVEKLEKIFEDSKINYIDYGRNSVV